MILSLVKLQYSLKIVQNKATKTGSHFTVKIKLHRIKIEPYIKVKIDSHSTVKIETHMTAKIKCHDLSTAKK